MCVRITKEDALERLTLALGSTCYFHKVNYINNNTKVTITCKYHGDFQIVPSKVFHRGTGCPDCFKVKRLGLDLEILNKIDESKEYYVDCLPYDYETLGIVATDKIRLTCEHGSRYVSMRKIREGFYGCGACKHGISWGERLETFKILYEDIYLYEDLPTNTKLNGKDKIRIFCNKHGWFSKSITKHMAQGCPSCAKESLKPHNLTLAERHKEDYLKIPYYLYIFKLSTDIFKVGISKDPYIRLQKIINVLGLEDAEIIYSKYTNLYDAIVVEDQVFPKFNLTCSKLFNKKVAGYTEIFESNLDVVQSIQDFLESTNSENAA